MAGPGLIEVAPEKARERRETAAKNARVERWAEDSGNAARPGGAEPAANPPGDAASGGFAGKVTLTVPLATVTNLADRPGELAGLGPVDPWLAEISPPPPRPTPGPPGA